MVPPYKRNTGQGFQTLTGIAFVERRQGRSSGVGDRQVDALLDGKKQ